MTLGRFAGFEVSAHVRGGARRPSLGRWDAAQVGASVWQTPGGVVAEIERINADIVAFSAELTAEAGRRGYHVADPIAVSGAFDDAVSRAASLLNPGLMATAEAASHIHDGGGTSVVDVVKNAADKVRADAAADAARDPVVDLFRGTWMPFARNWHTFFEANKGWTDNVWWNHAPEAEQFLNQLRAIRATAKRLGMNVLSPEPGEFGKSILDPSRDPTKPIADVTGTLMTVVKYALYGGLVIGGVFSLSAFYRNMMGTS